MSNKNKLVTLEVMQEYHQKEVEALKTKLQYGGQSNYTQADPEAPDYIKNRPFYEDITIVPSKKYLIDLSTFDLESAQKVTVDDLTTLVKLSDDILTLDRLIGGEIKTTYNDGEDTIKITEESILGFVEGTFIIDSPAVPFVLVQSTAGIVESMGIDVPGTGLYFIYESAVQSELLKLELSTAELSFVSEFKKLDAKFLPDEVARVEQLVQADWNQNDISALSYVKNKPFYEEEFDLEFDQDFTYEINGAKLYSSDIKIPIPNSTYYAHKFFKDLPQDALYLEVIVSLYGVEHDLEKTEYVPVTSMLDKDSTNVYLEFIASHGGAFGGRVIHVGKLIRRNYKEVTKLNEKFLPDVVQNAIQEVEVIKTQVAGNVRVEGGSGEKSIKMQDRGGAKGNTFTFVRDGVCNNQAVGNLANAGKISQFWREDGQVVHDASGVHASAFGGITLAKGDRSHSEGSASVALGIAAHVEGSNNVANGANTHAEGSQTTAYSDGTHAEGSGTIAYGSGAHAEGVNTIAGGVGSHVEGFGSNDLNKLLKVDGAIAGDVGALGDYSHVEGIESLVKATGTGGHAEGTNTIVEGISGHAEGEWTIAKGQSSHAEGIGSNADGKGSHAEGFETTASGEGAHSEGIGFETAGETTTYYKASGKASHVEGYCTTASKEAAHAEGYKTTASGTYAHAEGLTTQALEKCAHAEGENTIAKGTYSHAEGKGCHAEGTRSHAEGNETKALTAYSHAEGLKTTVSNGEAGHAEGNESAAEGAAAHAEGRHTSAKGTASHSEGYYTVASGAYTHAEGQSVQATGQGAHAEGFNTVAYGKYSHAEGYSPSVGTIADGFTAEQAKEYQGDSNLDLRRLLAYGTGAHAEGRGTLALGNYSHAEGYGGRATGIAAHSEGYSTKAIGDYSHASGYATFASGTCASANGYNSEAWEHQFVIGHYIDGNNKLTSERNYDPETTPTAGRAFMIGNGYGWWSAGRGSNAFRVDYDGNVYTYDANGKYNTGGADYAEYFEWLDSNPADIDRRGYFVTLEGEKIKLANPGDYVLGIISGMPAIVGNSDEGWRGRYLRDEFDAPILETVTYTEEITDTETNEVKTVTKTCTRYKQNPDYDGTIEYIPRANRPEWDAVGMVGVLSVRDDGTCKVNGFCKVAEGGIATTADTGYRVVKRVNDHIVKVIFK